LHLLLHHLCLQLLLLEECCRLLLLLLLHKLLLLLLFPPLPALLPGKRPLNLRLPKFIIIVIITTAVQIIISD
jgi:hypothetical protein